MSTNLPVTDASMDLLAIVRGLRAHMAEYLEGDESTYTRQNARLRLEVYDQVLELLADRLPGVELEAACAVRPGSTLREVHDLLAFAARGGDEQTQAA
jgi:hypothetical protein